MHLVRKAIANLLHEVSDPEIPSVSIVDLGMVIDILNQKDIWHIKLAPTYSGCPAIDVIPYLVKERLGEAGFKNVSIEMQITPPWSTDWISEMGRNKLFDYGIAPPNGRAGLDSEEGIPKACPQCGSNDVNLISMYGSTPCKAAYQCNTCAEPFEYFKCF